MITFIALDLVHRVWSVVELSVQFPAVQILQKLLQLACQTTNCYPFSTRGFFCLFNINAARCLLHNQLFTFNTRALSLVH